MTTVVSHADVMDKTPDPEVPERAKRPRSYSARYKAEILAEYERLAGNRCWASSSPRWSTATAVWLCLWGSTPIRTCMDHLLAVTGRRFPGGQADLGQDRPLLSHSLGGCRQDRATVLKPTRSGRHWQSSSDLSTPWNPTAADHRDPVPIQQVGWQLAEHAGERTPDV
jgi:hypothetical protein